MYCPIELGFLSPVSAECEAHLMTLISLGHGRTPPENYFLPEVF
jgi:hypothetical protein